MFQWRWEHAFNVEGKQPFPAVLVDMKQLLKLQWGKKDEDTTVPEGRYYIDCLNID